jgi:hypothetical protein
MIESGWFVLQSIQTEGYKDEESILTPLLYVWRDNLAY